MQILKLLRYPKCLESNRISKFFLSIRKNTCFCWKRHCIGLKAVKMYAQKTDFFPSEETNESELFLKPFMPGAVL